MKKLPFKIIASQEINDLNIKIAKLQSRNEIYKVLLLNRGNEEYRSFCNMVLHRGIEEKIYVVVCDVALSWFKLEKLKML